MFTKYRVPLLFCMLAAFAFSSCYKDESNDGVVPVNYIAVSDSASVGRIYINQGDTLKLRPLLKPDEAIPEDQLEYQWLAYDNSTLSSYVQPNVYMSTEHELNYVINAADFTLGQDYRVRFRVTDKRNGRSSYLAYNITIANRYGTGWLTLEDKNGTGDLSMIFPDGSLEHNVYSSKNTAVLNNPRKLEIAPFDVTDEISSTGKRMYILAAGGSQEYNYLTMVKKFDYDFLFFSAPAIRNPQRMVWESTIAGVNKYASIGVAINNGKVHSNLVGGFPGTKKWGGMMQSPEGNYNYTIAPFIAGGSSNFPSVVYDNQGKRFLIVNSSSPSLAAFASTASSVFDMNNVGLTMVFQDSSSVQYEYNAIMKNDAGAPYLVRYKTTSASSAALSLSRTEMNAPDVLALTAAAGSTHSPHLYYSVANRIISYETTSNTSTAAFSFSTAEQVTAMKYQRFATDKTGPQLTVATWDGTQGRVYFFPISNTGILGAPKATYSGFGRIVDMGFKR